MAEDVSNLDDPLHNLYSDYRDALYNKKYYGFKLKRCRQWNMGLEIATAIGTSSAIGAFVIFKQGLGKNAWVIITSISTIIVVLKPIINLSGQIERYAKLYSGHSSVYYDLEQLVRKVRVLHDFTPEMQELHMNTIARRKDLDPLDDLTVDESLDKKFYNEVNKEIPPESLWMP